MKVILNESRFNTIFSEWLDKTDTDVIIGWFGPGRINGYDERIITGYVKLYQGRERIGPSGGFHFSYKYEEDNELSLYGIEPDVNGRIYHNFGGVFKIFPTELLIEYFSGLIKDYLYEKIESK